LVTHPSFGSGVVEEVRGEACIVRFGQGKPRTILASYLTRESSTPAFEPRAGVAHFFDAYLVVDWSANNAPKSGADSVWYCLFEPAQRVVTTNPRTRSQAYEQLRAQLADLVGRGRRVLVGFDFPFGYPAGTGERLDFSGGDPWRIMWDELCELIEDGPDNKNNRFEVAGEINGGMTTGPAPFWGCPPKEVGPFLQARKPKPWPADIPELRAADGAIAGLKSPWQLMGAGSVGSQALVGIPWLAKLRDDPDLVAASRVWPFETGVGPLPTPAEGEALVLYAEVYPSLVPPSSVEAVRDAGQVRALAEHFARLDAEGEIAELFDLAGLPAEQRGIVAGEEGWILGARPGMTETEPEEESPAGA